ncbi:hypothetical protein Hanom_Chr14g01257781 [Helianthus anomalus]
MVMKDSEFYRSITRPRDSKFYMSIQGLAGMMVSMERDKFKWVVEDDIELEDGLKFFVQRYKNWKCGTELSMKNWKLFRMMKQSELHFTED